MDCSPPGSSLHGILQARILEWVCHVLLQEIFPTQGSNPCLLCLLHWQTDSLPLAPPGIQHKVTVIFGSFSSSAVRKKRLLIRNVTNCISNSNDMSPTVVAALTLPFSAALFAASIPLASEIFTPTGSNPSPLLSVHVSFVSFLFFLCHFLLFPILYSSIIFIPRNSLLLTHTPLKSLNFNPTTLDAFSVHTLIKRLRHNSETPPSLTDFLSHLKFPLAPSCTCSPTLFFNPLPNLTAHSPIFQN